MIKSVFVDRNYQNSLTPIDSINHFSQGEGVFSLGSERRFFHKVLYFLLLIIVLAGFPGIGSSFARDSASNCRPTQWPSQLSRLVPDSSLLRGKLENGFRYVIKANHEPKNRVALYLDVQAGSLQESDSQRGLAHFLEHMMFNGSKNFPPGSLVDYFQSMGMNFGGDTNARTTHDQTVYNIILPNSSEKDLDSGFLVIADYARGALLADPEIDRERGVILAEKRTRDSAGYRNNIAVNNFALRGTRYPERMPIGVKKTIEDANHDLLQSYYDAWYRPENMILVVVGDMNPKLTKDLIEKHFAKLSAAGPKPRCPDFGKLKGQGSQAYYHYEPELGQTNVAIQTFWDLPSENDSLRLEKKEILNFMGTMIMGYRLQRLQESAVPYARAFYDAGDIVNRIGYGALSAQVDKEHWQETITSLDRILRQTLSDGFEKNEVDRAKKEILGQLDARVLTAGSEDSRTIAGRIIDQLNKNRVYQSAEQEKTLYGPLVKEITVSEVNKVFREIWSHNYRLISVTGDVRLGNGGTKEIASIYRKSTQQSVPASNSYNTDIFPYLQPSPSHASAPQIRFFKDIDVERLAFSNGLIVNLKKTQFERNRIRVSADFGSGKQKERIPGMAMLVESVINGSGSGKLPQSAIDGVLAGSSIQLSFKVGESAFSWTGTTLTKDFDLFSQVLYTLLLDPGFRKNVFTTVKEKFGLMYRKMNQEIEGAFPLAIEPFLATYNERFGLPPWENVDKLDYGVVEQWADSIIRPDDLEISVVGDFNRDEVISTLTKYFSGIKLISSRKIESPSVQFPLGKKLDVTVDTSVQKSMVAVAWPTDDFWDIHRTRRLHILASVFGDRLRKTIREKLAASYSPNVSSFNSRVYPNYGFIIAQMLVKPGTEDVLIKEIFKISDRLKREGITSNELARAKDPFLTSLKESIGTNQYWLNSVLSLSMRHPLQLEWPRTLISDFTSISLSEVNELAALYLDNDNAATAKVMPDKGKKNR